MKLDPLFKSQSNKLYFLDGRQADALKSISLSACDCVNPKNYDGKTDSLLAIKIPWSLTGMDEESYNEEFLSSLRDFLKGLEEYKVYAFIVPFADVTCESESQKEDFTASMKHCARRIKDCSSIIGFAIPEEVSPSFFMEELKAKHGHYIFFSRNQELLLSDPEIVKY